MTASTTADPAPLATLDEQITRALIALRQARTASRLYPTPETARQVIRAEENFNALLDYRSFVRHRSG